MEAARHQAAALRSDESDRRLDACLAEQPGEPGQAETVARVSPAQERPFSAQQELTARRLPGGLPRVPQAHWAERVARVQKRQLIRGMLLEREDEWPSQVSVALQERCRVSLGEQLLLQRAAQPPGAPKRSQAAGLQESSWRRLRVSRELFQVLVRPLAHLVEPTPRAWPSHPEPLQARRGEQAWLWQPWPLLPRLLAQPTGGNAVAQVRRGQDRASWSASFSR